MGSEECAYEWLKVFAKDTQRSQGGQLIRTAPKGSANSARTSWDCAKQHGFGVRQT